MNDKNGFGYDFIRQSFGSCLPSSAHKSISISSNHQELSAKRIPRMPPGGMVMTVP
jgi:hypothetical protein